MRTNPAISEPVRKLCKERISMTLFKHKQKVHRIILKLKRGLKPAEIKYLKRWLRILKSEF